MADPLLPALLTRVPLDTVDSNNQQARQENRQVCVCLSADGEDIGKASEWLVRKDEWLSGSREGVRKDGVLEEERNGR